MLFIHIFTSGWRETVCSIFLDHRVITHVLHLVWSKFPCQCGHYVYGTTWSRKALTWDKNVIAWPGINPARTLNHQNNTILLNKPQDDCHVPQKNWSAQVTHFSSYIKKWSVQSFHSMLKYSKDCGQVQDVFRNRVTPAWVMYIFLCCGSVLSLV